MTEILNSNPVNPDIGPISRAAEIIIGGGTVAFPTETVYGIGADAFNGAACGRIFEAKGRPRDNPLIVHISSLKQLEGVAVDVPKEISVAMNTLWPGPVTFILKRADGIPDEVSAGLDTVAVRMPAHPIALRLIDASKTPIAAPSANLAGKPSPTNAAHVISDLNGRVDAIIDGGDCAFGLESTIVDVTRRPYAMLRPGAFTIEELSGILGPIEWNGIRVLGEGERPMAPGMKYRHYAPEARLEIVEKRLLLDLPEINMPYAVLCTDDAAGAIHRANARVVRLGSESNLYGIAKMLFDSFRKLDAMGVKLALVQEFPERGIGLALMNRIRKASGRETIRTRAELEAAIRL